MTKNIFSRLFSILLLLGTSLWVYFGGAPERTVETPPARQTESLVKTSILETTPYRQPLTLEGKTRAENEDILTFKADGLISKISVQKGDMVQKGDVLISLDTTLAQANLTQAKSGVDLAQAKVTRLEQLVSSGAIQATSLDEAKTALLQTQATLSQAQDAFDKRTLLAPFKGEVIDVMVEPGTQTNIGQEAIQLVNTQTLYADIMLSNRDYTLLDSEATGLSNMNDTPVTVTYKSNRAGETGLFPLEVKFDDSQNIPVNTLMTFTLYGKETNATQITLDTLTVNAEGDIGVYVVENNKAHFEQVRLLSSTDVTWVEGLDPSTEVVIQGQGSLSDEQLVKRDN
jgi:RND family efflux transporter MFP subunit